MTYTNPWVYRGEIFDDAEGYDSFVYIIRNTLNGKAYIGKKTLVSRKTKQVNGKKKKTKVESTWRNYYGSSADLLADIELLGKDKFTREILHLCNNRGSANYLEAREQFTRGVLESDGWYNMWIDCKIHRSHVKINDPCTE
jgi:hypothetical protein